MILQNFLITRLFGALNPMALITLLLFVAFAPTKLIAQTTQKVSLTITFTDNANNESQFNLYRCTVPAGQVTCPPSTKVATIPAKTTTAPSTVTFIDTILNDTGGVTYCYNADAENSAGLSSRSNNGCGTSAVIITIPTPPTNLQVPSVQSTSAQLQWNNTSGQENIIEFRRSGQPYAFLARYSIAVESIFVTQLRRNSTYDFRIKT